MRTSFTVNRRSYDPGFGYVALHSMSAEFLQKLTNTIAPFGYSVITGDDTREWVTSEDEAKVFKMYSRDFQIAKGTARSRIFRLFSKLTNGSLLSVCVVGETGIDLKAFLEKKRLKKEPCIFAQFSELPSWNGTKLKYTPLTPNQAPVWYYSVIVNEDMVLVSGGNSPVENADCIHCNYMSFIRLFSIHKANKETWLTNGYVGWSDKPATADRPYKTGTGYAQIGCFLKIAAPDEGIEWASSRILILPGIRSYANRTENYDFTEVFNSHYNNTSENIIMQLYSTSPKVISENPSIILY